MSLLPTYARYPVTFVRGEGARLWDDDGSEYLDFLAGISVSSVGHCHPKVVEAVREQAGRLLHTSNLFFSEPIVRLAERLSESSLGGGVFFTNSGTEAVEAAIKLVRKARRGGDVLSVHGAFHGRTYGAMSIGGKRSAAGTKGFGPFLPGVAFVPFPYCYRCPFGQTPDNCRLHGTDYLDWVVETETEDNVAAVIVETYQGGSGSIMAPEGWFPKLEAWCRRRDALLIVDEVQASFGRTGKLFGFEHYGITPNLLCLGKGISSSVPLSAIVGESRIMESLTPGSLGSTHGGNALCARVALENIDVILEERLSENAARVGQAMMARLRELQQRHECLGDVRGLGLVFGLEMVKSKETRQPDAEVTRRVVEAAYRRGLLLIAPIGFYGNVLRVAPPLVITEEEALAGVDILDQAIAEATGGA